MKKLLALLLCLSMVLGTTAYAAETELNKDVLEGQTTLSLTIRPEDNEFVVVIPATVEIDPETKSGSFNVVLKAGWKLPSANGLQVRIKEFANGVDNSSTPFTLKDSEGTTVKYEMSVKGTNFSRFISLMNRDVSEKDGQSTVYSAFDYKTLNLISISKSTANTTDIKTQLKISVPTLPTTPGEYTDTITFAITLN